MGMRYVGRWLCAASGRVCCVARSSMTIAAEA